MSVIWQFHRSEVQHVPICLPAHQAGLELLAGLRSSLQAQSRTSFMARLGCWQNSVSRGGRPEITALLLDVSWRPFPASGVRLHFLAHGLIPLPSQSAHLGSLLPLVLFHLSQQGKALCSLTPAVRMGLSRCPNIICPVQGLYL